MHCIADIGINIANTFIGINIANTCFQYCLILLQFSGICISLITF